MGVQTTLTCDRCRASCDVQAEDKKEGRQFWEVRVGAYPRKMAHLNVPSASKVALWCRTCLAEFGMMPTTDDGKKVEPAPTPTMEDLVREIVREEVGQ